MSQKESFFSVHDGKPIDPVLFGYADIFHYGRRDSQQRLNKQQADRTTSDQTLSSHDQEIMRSILARVARIRCRGGGSQLPNEDEPQVDDEYDRANLFRISKAGGSRTKYIGTADGRPRGVDQVGGHPNATEPLRSSTHQYLTNLFSQMNFNRTAQGNRRFIGREKAVYSQTRDSLSQDPQKLPNEDRLMSTIANLKQKTSKLCSLERESKKSLIRSRHTRRGSLGRSAHEPLKEGEQYMEWLAIINWTNAMHQIVEPTGSYKALVERGNNHRLVKTALKSRPWWVVVECSSVEAINNLGQFNLIWSQNKYQRVIDLLPQHNVRVYNENFRQRVIQIPLGNRPKNYVNEIEQGLNRLVPNSISVDTVHIAPCSAYQQYSYSPNILKTHNHLEYHRELSNKKSLFRNLKSYYLKQGKDPFQHIPLTFHVTGASDAQFCQFEEKFGCSGVWLVKPGENTNRGTGISVVDSVDAARQCVTRYSAKHRTFIIQQYILPFLYEKRKFDIRCYVLVTSMNRMVKGYWYEEGYIRTSGKPFTLDNLASRMVHLTNDAVQKKSEDYGKYEPANKLSFQEFEKYLSQHHPQLSFWRSVYPQMTSLAADCLEASWQLLDRRHRQHTFEVFGLDFLIDQNFKPWLIEVNTNPCLQESSLLLGRIIPAMLDNALRIALDPIFPPPKPRQSKLAKLPNPFNSNKFTLIFNKQDSSGSTTRHPPLTTHATLFTQNEF